MKGAMFGVFTYSTVKPDSRIMRAVPPEARIRTFCWMRPLARSNKPVLSKTDTMAIRCAILELVASR